MGPSDMFGELSIFDPGPRTSSATTITEVRAVSMDRDALRAWIADRPEIAEQLLRVLARRLRRTNNNLADLIFTDVPGRVAKQLLQLAQRFGTQEGGQRRVRLRRPAARRPPRGAGAPPRVGAHTPPWGGWGRRRGPPARRVSCLPPPAAGVVGPRGPPPPTRCRFCSTTRCRNDTESA